MSKCQFSIKILALVLLLYVKVLAMHTNTEVETINPYEIAFAYLALLHIRSSLCYFAGFFFFIDHCIWILKLSNISFELSSWSDTFWTLFLLIFRIWRICELNYIQPQSILNCLTPMTTKSNCKTLTNFTN